MSFFYTVSVKISTHKSIDLLKFLAKNGFSTFYVDNCSGNMTIIAPLTITDQELNEFDRSDQKWFHFQSIYGSKTPPPQEALKRIENSEEVLSFKTGGDRIG